MVRLLLPVGANLSFKYWIYMITLVLLIAHVHCRKDLYPKFVNKVIFSSALQSQC